MPVKVDVIPPPPANSKQPGVTKSLLYNGSRFQGSQKSKGNSYDVEVVLQVSLLSPPVLLPLAPSLFGNCAISWRTRNLNRNERGMIFSRTKLIIFFITLPFRISSREQDDRMSLARVFARGVDRCHELLTICYGAGNMDRLLSH